MGLIISGGWSCSCPLFFQWECENRTAALNLEPAGTGVPGASGRHEQVIDRVDERCQINRRTSGDDLAVGDRGIDEGYAGIFQVRLDAPPAGNALATSQSGIRKDPWTVADRGDDFTPAAAS